MRVRCLGRAMPAAGGYGLRAQVQPGYSRSLGQVFYTYFVCFQSDIFQWRLGVLLRVKQATGVSLYQAQLKGIAESMVPQFEDRFQALANECHPSLRTRRRQEIRPSHQPSVRPAAGQLINQA